MRRFTAQPPGDWFPSRVVPASAWSRAVPRAILLLLFVAVALGHGARGATLEWNLNPEPEVAGYKVYIGTEPGVYQRVIDAGLTNRYHLCGLETGVTYFFALTAYAFDGLESDFSEEVSYTRPFSEVRVTPVAFGRGGSSGDATLTFIEEPNREHFIQASTNLVTWQTLEVLAPAGSGSRTWNDPGAAAAPIRFYRVISVPW